MTQSDKLAHVVARAIVQNAVDDGVTAGESLGSESETMRRYEVSRGTLREALRVLEVLGFVELKRGPAGGPILLEADVHQFSRIATLHYQRLGVTYQELLEMRLILEPAAAALCAEKRTPQHRDRLLAYLSDTQSVDLANDKSFRTAGHGFHELIAQMSGNRLLNLVASSCYDVFADRASSFIYPSNRRHVVVKAHQQIAQAILDGKAADAHAFMQQHMQDYVTQATRQFRGLIGETVRW